MDWSEKYFSTMIIVCVLIALCTLMNAKFDRIEKDIVVIKTYMILSHQQNSIGINRSAAVADRPVVDSSMCVD